MNDYLRASPISWSALVTIVLAIVAGVFGYGQLSQRVASLEALEPRSVATKLAVIESEQKRASADISQIQKDVRQLLNNDWGRRGP